MPLTWVIGAGGLVGQGVWRAARSAGYDPRRQSVPWLSGPDDQAAALRHGSQRVADEAAGEPWTVIWVAGAGVVGTPAEVLDREASVFGGFLDDLAALPHGRAPAGVFFASSAGGVYAGSAVAPFTEQSAVAPLAPYGHQKLAMEGRITEFARQTGIPVMIGRPTNVYGPGQNLTKAQGLVSQLALCHLMRRPISLYVSLDTTRDYVFVDDCARMIVAGMTLLTRSSFTEPVVKIIGSGLPVTIATLLGEFHRLARRSLPVVLADSPNRRFQVRDLRMRSTTWTQLDRLASTTLPAGIGATVADLAARFRGGEMAPGHPR